MFKYRYEFPDFEILPPSCSSTQTFFPDFFCPDPDFYLWEESGQKKVRIQNRKNPDIFFTGLIYSEKNQHFWENIEYFQSILKVKNNGNKKTNHFWTYNFLPAAFGGNKQHNLIENGI